MHKKISKAALSSLMSAAMLATSVAAVAPMTVNAGQVLGNGDFDDGTSLPWHTCESQPAKQTFEIKDGKYVVHIVDSENGPEGRWDLQFRHRGLNVIKGHKYTISGDIEADADGYIYAKVGNYQGDKEYWHGISGQEWQPYKIKKGEKFHFEYDWEMKDNPDGPTEWAFHYSDNHGMYDGKDTGMPSGSTLTFDNLSLVDNTGNEGDFDKTNEFGVVRPRSNVRVNQVGYYPNLEKRASYVTDNATPCEFEVRDASGKAVYTGTASKVVQDPDSGNGETTTTKYGTKVKDSGKYVQILDFSEVKTPGKYKIFVKDTVGVSDTACFNLKGAWDTKASGDKLIWENWKTGLSYTMNESMEFRIDNNIYDDAMLANAVNYYYQNRSGIPIESKYITSGDATTLAHPAGHTKDDAYVQSKWVKFYSNKFDGDKTYTIDGVGGWYDAGDHGKYVVNGGISVWTLQNTYELAKKLGTADKYNDGGVMSIPENSNGYPDILDEARYELEWMFKMVVSSKDPYWGKSCENFVYHKLHDHKWTGLATKAWEYEEEWGTTRIVKPPTYAATLNVAACAAQASRLWKELDPKFSDECLEVAKKTYAAIKGAKGWQTAKGDYKTDPQFAPLDQAIGGGPYGDTYVEDDFYWAACELFATTGDAEYYTDLSGYKNKNSDDDYAFHLTTNLGGGENKGSFSSFNWGCTSGLGTLSLYLNPTNVKPDDYKSVVDSITGGADKYIAYMHSENNGMGIPYRGSTFTDPNNIGVDENGKEIEVEGYEWGSNSFVINNAMVMAYAYDATGKGEYLNGASEALDYLFGRNGLCFSYVSGYGTHFLKNPHHRWWSHDVDPSFPMAPAGVLSGGPGAGMQDPYVGGLGYIRGTVASQKSYVDSAEAWSVNEVTINWNAPLVAMVSFMEDTAGKGVVPTPPTPGTPSTPATSTPATPTPGTPGATATLWGDANCDSKVDISDAVLIMQSQANPSKYSLTEQGKANADVNLNGNGVTNADALAIQKYLLKIVPTLPES
jgi:endoglucanase